MTTERFLTRWVGASSGQCDHPKVESRSMKVIDMVEAQGSQPSLPTFESITKSYHLVYDIAIHTLTKKKRMMNSRFYVLEHAHYFLKQL